MSTTRQNLVQKTTHNPTGQALRRNIRRHRSWMVHWHLTAVHAGGFGIGFGPVSSPARHRPHRPGRAGTGSRLLTVVALLFLAACATQAKYRTYVDGFVGKNADQLYATWGAPLRSANTPTAARSSAFSPTCRADAASGSRDARRASSSVATARCVRPVSVATPATRGHPWPELSIDLTVFLRPNPITEAGKPTNPAGHPCHRIFQPVCRV